MDLKLLIDFLSLCNSGNFRVSSEQRLVTQPAFSRRIKALETWLGAELFDRTSFPVCPTKFGQEFKPIAEQIVRLAELARSDVIAQTRVASTTLSIATLHTLASAFVPRWLISIIPEINVKQTVIRTDFRSVEDYLNGLEEKLVDFLICYEDKSKLNLIDAQKFPSLRLGKETLNLVSVPDVEGLPLHRIPHNSSGPCALLKLNSNSHLYRPIHNQQVSKFGHVEFLPVYEASTTNALKAMALEGFGMAWLPTSIIRDELANGQLVPAAEADDCITLDIKIHRFEQNTEPQVDALWSLLLTDDLSV